MNWEKKQILVTVKAYPNPSKKYNETVCVAGIDLANNKWIRLYPIPFRDLEDEKKFKKYSIFEANVKKAVDDKRPESFKIDVSSIKVIDRVGTKNEWAARKKIISPTASNSFCEILNESSLNDKSLGMFKPQRISFICSKSKIKDIKTRESCYAQPNLYNPLKNVIEEIPFDFKYSFHCINEPACVGHTLQIIDWEIIQAYRYWRRLYKEESVLLEKIKEKWLMMFSAEKDSYLFVGNWKRFRSQFMVLGVFYPPLKS